jgi:3-deoxy-D-manno-octulosonic-acid transferase
MNSVATRGNSGPLAARISLGIYRYAPLLLYWLLLAGYYLLPFLRPSLRERLGLGPPQEGKGPLVWFHGSSVGEVSSIGPVVSEIRSQVPDARILVTTMTVTGRRRAERELEGVKALVAPLDFVPAVRRLVRVLKPSILIVGETEIWPNLLVETSKAGASLVLVNGRISRKSYPRYRIVKPLIEFLLGHFDLLLMRSETDARRIIDLGASTEKVKVMGNTKFDILPRPLSAESRAEIRQELGIDASRLVISIGSARSGESEIVLEAVRSALADLHPLVIIAPRHMNLVPQLEELCRAKGFTHATIPRRSLEDRGAAQTDVLIVGQMGRLLDVYAVSDMSIVGGTFKPLGGHNPLEPASQGTVTIVGPYFHNITDDIEYLRAEGGAKVTDEKALAGLLATLAGDKAVRDQLARQAVAAVRHRKGIAARCVGMMAEEGLLPEGPV